MAHTKKSWQICGPALALNLDLLNILEGFRKILHLEYPFNIILDRVGEKFISEKACKMAGQFDFLTMRIIWKQQLDVKKGTLHLLEIIG